MASDDVVAQQDPELDEILRKMTDLEMEQLEMVIEHAETLIHQDRCNECMRKVLRAM